MNSKNCNGQSENGQIRVDVLYALKSGISSKISFEPWASLVAQMLKNLLAMQETQVRFLGQEDPLEKGMATHSSILNWRIPLTEELGGLQSMGVQRVGHDWATNTFTFNRYE